LALLCGIDIIEINRIEKSLDQKFKNRIFTEGEIIYCESKKINRFKSYAARFAAKEAVFKALDAGRGSRIRWKDIEVRNTELGYPQIILSGNALEMYKKIKGTCISISLSHCESYAVASAVVTYEEDI
jgi:holo-[acyl-carrier protein] synthase